MAALVVEMVEVVMEAGATGEVAMGVVAKMAEVTVAMQGAVRALVVKAAGWVVAGVAALSSSTH